MSNQVEPKTLWRSNLGRSVLCLNFVQYIYVFKFFGKFELSKTPDSEAFQDKLYKH